MSLADLLSKIEPVDRCKLQRVYEELDERDRLVLSEALQTGVPSTRLSLALRAMGYAVSDNVIGRHRKGVCICKDLKGKE